MEPHDLFLRGYETDARQLPLFLEDFRLRHPQEPVERPGGIPFHTWLQCVKGTGEVIAGGMKSVARTGDCVFLRAGAPYSYTGTTSKWITNYITFSGAACETILTSLNLDRSGVYHLSDPANLTRHFQRLQRVWNSAPQQPHRLLSKELYAMLLDLSLNVRYLEATAPAHSNEPVQRVVQYIETHFHEPILLADLAEMVDLRKEYLCSLFKKQMNQTIFQFIHAIRIAHARIHLVRHPEKTIQEIGGMCGFESASYFCRVFRSYVHTTPQEYRRTH